MSSRVRERGEQRERQTAKYIKSRDATRGSTAKNFAARGSGIWPSAVAAAAVFGVVSALITRPKSCRPRLQPTGELPLLLLLLVNSSQLLALGCAAKQHKKL